MPSTSSIFSSKWLRCGALWAALVIAAVEGLQAHRLPQRYLSHEVEFLLREMPHWGSGADRVILGDSVGLQLALGIEAQHRGEFTPLASNQTIEMAGQYFLLRRYLEARPAPRAVFLLMDDPLNGDLNSPYVENYIQRCFLRWSEIASLTVQGRPSGRPPEVR